MQVRADRAADSTALVAALAVVPESGDHTSERLGALVEDGAPGVVLEPGERPVLARKGALEQDIADHPPLARVGLQREHAGAREVAAVAVAVEAAEELVAAADGERRGATGDPLAKPFALRSQVVCDQRLLSVLSATDVVEVVFPGLDRVPDPDGAHLELEAAGRGAAREDRHVPAIGVDVQVVGIQVADPKDHAARSQYCGTLPRRASTRRSASIAV